MFLGPADKRWVTPDNPHGLWHPAISNSTLVLHYAYTTPGDVAVKAGRSCPENVVQAVLAGDVAQVGWAEILPVALGSIWNSLRPKPRTQEICFARCVAYKAVTCPLSSDCYY
jgi:hypothetical protein